MAKTRKNDSLENQRIRDIPLDSLILWTENPRDPMPGAQTNEEIIRHALDNESTWRLRRLSKEMGEEFDKSELPTVVKKPGTAHYIVFDGNRRVILAMLRRDGFPLEGDQFALPSFPDDMPCNVCDEETALRHVLRKHSDTGSWSQLERDIFMHKYMGREKTVLIRMNELTGAISEYARLNQRYVEEDILNQKHQREMGLDPDKYDFGIDAGLLRELLETIEDKIEKGELSTRGKRNDPVAALPEDLLSRIRENATHHRTVTPPPGPLRRQYPLRGLRPGSDLPVRKRAVTGSPIPRRRRRGTGHAAKAPDTSDASGIIPRLRGEAHPRPGRFQQPLQDVGIAMADVREGEDQERRRLPADLPHGAAPSRRDGRAGTEHGSQGIRR